MSAKLSEISNACNAVIVNGVDIKFGEENVHFNLSIEDQSNINNLFRVVELGGTEFPYQADGGVCRIYTAAEIAAIYIAAQTLITTQTTYHNELKQYVQTLTSSEISSAQSMDYSPVPTFAAACCILPTIACICCCATASFSFISVR